MPCPPVTAEFVSSLQANAAGAVPKPPQLTAFRFFRSSLGQTRVDTSSLSILQDPVTARTILLDHGSKLAHISPLTPNVSIPGVPQMPGMPAIPQMPQMPGAPPLPGMNMQALGTSMLQGHEVQGFRYVIPPPQPPQIPGAPQMPGAPQLPGMPAIPGVPQPPQIPGMPQFAMPQVPPMPQAPGIPGAPQVPQLPQVPTTVEAWSAQKICLPMATKIDGGFGSQTSTCRNVSVGEPNPAFFQIPPDYKQFLTAKPKTA